MIGVSLFDACNSRKLPWKKCVRLTFNSSLTQLGNEDFYRCSFAHGIFARSCHNIVFEQTNKDNNVDFNTVSVFLANDCRPW